MRGKRPPKHIVISDLKKKKKSKILSAHSPPLSDLQVERSSFTLIGAIIKTFRNAHWLKGLGCILIIFFSAPGPEAAADPNAPRHPLAPLLRRLWLPPGFGLLGRILSQPAESRHHYGAGKTTTTSTKINQIKKAKHT